MTLEDQYVLEVLLHTLHCHLLHLLPPQFSPISLCDESRA
jgi:hypothetical protein